MRDDDAMDELLRETFAAPVPRLSPGFDARLMRSVRPRRLSATGRALMTGYALVAAVTAGWLMRELPPAALATAMALAVVVAAGASAYGRHLAFGSSRPG